MVIISAKYDISAWCENDPNLKQKVEHTLPLEGGAFGERERVPKYQVCVYVRGTPFFQCRAQNTYSAKENRKCKG